MKKTIYLSLWAILFFSIITKAQIHPLLNTNTFITSNDSVNNFRHLIKLNVTSKVNSIGLPNSFYNDFTFRRGFISEETINNTYKNLNDNNVIGGLLKGGISLYRKNKKNDVLKFSLSHQQYSSLNFKNRLFELAFIGNRSFLGDSVNIGPVKSAGIQYTAIGIDYFKKLNKKLTIGFGVNIDRGIKINSVEFDQSKMTTGKYGEFINLDSKFEAYLFPYDSNASPIKANGWGGHVNLYLNYQVSPKTNINISGQNIGLIKWKNAKHYQGDSVWNYTGIDINSIISNGNNNNTSLSVDSLLKDLGVTNDSLDITTILPINIELNFYSQLNEKYSLNYGINYIKMPHFIPRLYFQIHKKSKFQFYPNAGIEFGGFGIYNINLGFNKIIKDSWRLQLETYGIEAFIFPNKTAGQGILLNLVKAI